MIQPTNLLKTTTTAANSAGTKKEVFVSREIDGYKNTGAVGELLTVGTEHLADANQYFLMNKFKVSSLLAEDNSAISQKFNAVGPQNAGEQHCADDMYVAGDPGVGGKGNNYAYNHIDPNTGFITMLEDGADNGRKVTINGHVEEINENGNKAFTEYGFVVQDDNGNKTKATLSGGQLNITDKDGNTKKLLPGEEYIVGNPSDPTAKFYYADVPGAGENGQAEKRLMFESFEKPSQETIDKLVAEGVKKEDAEALRTKTTSSFGFRVPDGNGTYRQSDGVGSGQKLNETSNGVKTYYDAHFGEGECKHLEVCDTPPPPKDVAKNEWAKIWNDPHVREADGGRYKITDNGTFNIIQDKNFAVNAVFSKGTGKRASQTTELGITVGGQKLYMNATTKSFTLDGQELAKNADIKLADGSVLKKRGATLTLQTAEYETKVSLHGGAWFNVQVESGNDGVAKDGVLPTGILGESFDEDNVRLTAPKQNIDAYRVANLYSIIANALAS